MTMLSCVALGLCIKEKKISNETKINYYTFFMYFFFEEIP